MTNENTQEKTLENIQNIQNMEKELQSKLDTSIAGKGLSKKEQEKIVDKINELTQIRTNLYSNLNDMYKNTQANVAENRNQKERKITKTSKKERKIPGSTPPLADPTNTGT